MDAMCEEHYPVISRESIIAEMDASEEYRKSQEHIHTFEEFLNCNECKDKIGGLLLKALKK